MAITDMSPAHKDAVGPTLKSTQNVMRRYRCRTHHSDGTNIGWVCQTAHTCQISRPICTPVTHKSDDFRLKFIFVHIILLSSGLSAQCAFDLGIKLMVVEAHQRRCLGRTYCCTGTASFTKSRVYFSHKFLVIKANGTVRADIDASQAARTQFRPNS